MLNVRYNPFSKTLEEINSEDLKILCDVQEGWYVEYKQEVPNTKSIAKSISALANSYGGWIFYGIKESEERKAGSFSGILATDAPQKEVTIRQSASTSIHPPPYFEIRTLYGPCNEISLPQGQAIIVIEVPASSNAPHIHNDGRIYRRVADEARPETDRHFLDLLWERNERYRKHLYDLFKVTPETSKGEENVSYMEAFLIPSFWCERFPKHHVKFKEFSVLMQDAQPENGGLPFDNLFATSNGYIARQALGNAYENLSLTWRYNFDGVTHVTIPFPSAALNADDIRKTSFFQGYTHISAFLDECVKRKISCGTMVDLNFAFAVLYGIIRRHEKLMALAEMPYPYHMKLRIHGMWRRIPYLDTETYLNFVKEFGIPIIQEDDSYWPPINNLCRLSTQDSQDENLWTALKSSLAFGGVCQTIGFPHEMLTYHENWYVEVSSLMERVKAVQSLRNQSADYR